MILDNLTRAFKTQNWLAVATEFVIVIAGVVIGFQINAWNEARVQKQTYQTALGSLETQLSENLSALIEQREELELENRHFAPAVRAILLCEPNPEAIDRALNDLNTGDYEFMVDAAEVALGPFLGSLLMSDQMRTDMARFRVTAANIAEDLDINERLIERGRLLNQAEMITLVESGMQSDDNYFSNGRWTLAAPFEEACQDSDLRKRLYYFGGVRIVLARQIELAEVALSELRSAVQAENERLAP